MVSEENLMTGLNPTSLIENNVFPFLDMSLHFNLSNMAFLRAHSWASSFSHLYLGPKPLN